MPNPSHAVPAQQKAEEDIDGRNAYRLAHPSDQICAVAFCEESPVDCRFHEEERKYQAYLQEPRAWSTRRPVYAVPRLEAIHRLVVVLQLPTILVEEAGAVLDGLVEVGDRRLRDCG